MQSHNFKFIVRATFLLSFEELSYVLLLEVLALSIRVNNLIEARSISCCIMSRASAFLKVVSHYCDEG